MLHIHTLLLFGEGLVLAFNVSITWSRGRGCGGGGGEGVELLPSLAPVGGEQGGVGSFGFRDLVDLRGNVFFSSWNKNSQVRNRKM